MGKRLKNLLLNVLILITIVQPLLTSLEYVHAEDVSTNPDTTAPQETPNDSPYDGISLDAQPKILSGKTHISGLVRKDPSADASDLVSNLSAFTSEEDVKTGMGIDDSLAEQVDPKIILNENDAWAIRTLYRLSGSYLLPDFDNEFQAIFDLYPKFKDSLPDRSKGLVINSADDIAKLKQDHPVDFQDFVHGAKVAWSADFGNVKKLVMEDASSLADLTGRDHDEIAEILAGRSNSDPEKAKQYQDQYNDIVDEANQAIASVKIDTRVLKMLVYLVTPKSQNGAGHWRVKVARIVSGYTSPNKDRSRESEVIYNAQQDNTQSDNRTAADFGQNRPTDNSSSNSTTQPFSINNNQMLTGNGTMAEITDQNGDQFNALIQNAKAADDTSTTTASDPLVESAEKNISAHADGQAIDISQIDDIRCTLIKKKRVGGDSKSKLSQRPIKLEWQTTQGYLDSGAAAAQQQDMANIMKQYASDGIRSLIDEFGGDISDYDGDLSSSNFSDIAMLLGKSIFSQIINSPGANLQGYNFGDTLEKLGAMYFADYLGLPRDLFLNRHYDTFDQFEEAIGAAAIEQRLKLPVGTFDGDNLNDMLLKIGERKVEYEMNLDKDDLSQYFKDTTANPIDAQNRDYIIGRAVIEKTLSLRKGSYSGPNGAAPKDYSELKDSIGKYKGDLMFMDPAYVDNVLHLDLGTTDKLKQGQISPTEFAAIVGRTRLNDTAYGFQYIVSNDAAFNLPTGTFQKIIAGDRNSLVDFAINMLASVFTSTDVEKVAFADWIRANKDSDNCTITDPIKIAQVQIPVYKKDSTGKTIYDENNNPVIDHYNTSADVTISEQKAVSIGLNKGDMFNLFGCKMSSSHAVFQRIGSKIIYFTVIQQALNPDQKIKINLTDVNPQFHSSDPDLQFYVNRVYRIPQIIQRIKDNWKDSGNDPQYTQVKAMIDTMMENIDKLYTGSMPIVDVNSAKKAGRNLSIQINTLSANVQNLQGQSNRYINKINGTLIDIQELVRTVSEIMEGKPIETSDNLTLSQVQLSPITTSLGSSSSQATTILNKPASKNTSTGSIPSKAIMMMLLSRKMNPKQFFISLASEKVEGELGLPHNSLVYFVQNFESKGVGTMDAFYSAVGQAKIEETFNLPEYYFQGPLLKGDSLGTPDFQNDLSSLRVYLDTTDIDSLNPKVTMNSKGPQKAYAADLSLSPSLADVTISRPRLSLASETPEQKLSNILGTNTPTTNVFGDANSYNQLAPEQKAAVDKVIADDKIENDLLWVKISNPREFDKLVAKAEKNYKDEIQSIIDEIGGNKQFEVSIDDIVLNINTYKLNDKIRSPEADLLFRLGIPGTLQGLEINTGMAWFGANDRANAIDKLLGIEQGSTRALFTGQKIPARNSKNNLSKEEKNLLSAKMGISPVALDKFSEVLSGEISYDEFADPVKGLALDITPTKDNPFFPKPAESDECQTTFQESNGTLMSNILISNGYLYFDADGPKVFANKNAAADYASVMHKDRQTTYLVELATGLNKITGIDTTVLKHDIDEYLNQPTDDLLFQNLNDDQYKEIEKNYGISKATFDKIFFKAEASDYNRPLVGYKKAVGKATVKNVLSYKLFSGLGLRVDPGLFTGDDFFQVMQGNFEPLWNIAGAMVDRQLGLPSGSVQAILTAPTANLKKCAMAEIGGSIVGKYIGLDYISMKGNVFQNIGRAQIEKSLGLPRNSFIGSNIDDLIKNVGAINIITAFQIPISDLNVDSTLAPFYDSTYINSIKNFSNNYKIQKIKDYLDVNSSLILNPNQRQEYDGLNQKLIDRIKNTAQKALPGGVWNQGGNKPPILSGGENEREVNNFIIHLSSIDSSFGLDPGSTAKMLAGYQYTEQLTETFVCNLYHPDPEGRPMYFWTNGNDVPCTYGDGPGDDNLTFLDGHRIKIGTCRCDPNKNPTWQLPVGAGTGKSSYITYTFTPDKYVEQVAQKTTLKFAVINGLGMIDGLTDEQNTAISNILMHINSWSKMPGVGYANLYDNLSTIFSWDLDQQAGLQEGTIKAIIANPTNARDILIPQALRKLDEMTNLDPKDKWSFSGIYSKYFNPTAQTTDSDGKPIQPDSKLDECSDKLPTQAQLDNWNTREAAIRQWIDEKSGYQLLEDTQVKPGVHITTYQENDITKDPDYFSKIEELQQIQSERSVADEDYQTCKAGNRGAKPGAVMANFTDPNGNKHQTIDWQLAYTIVTDYASDQINKEILKATHNTINMPAEDIKHVFVNGDMRYFNSALLAYTANSFIDKLSSDNDSSKAVPIPFQISYDMIKLWFVGDQSAEDYAATAAANQFFTPQVTSADIYYDVDGNPFYFDQTGGTVFVNQDFVDQIDSFTPPNSPNDVCGSGGVLGCLGSQDYYIQNPEPGTTNSYVVNPSPLDADHPKGVYDYSAGTSYLGAVNFNKTQTDQLYGKFDPNTTVATNAQIQELNNQATTCQNETESYAGSDANSLTDEQRQKIGDCNNTLSLQRDLNETMQTAREDSRSRFGKSTQYRMLDATLWTKDHNVYPGFAYALFEGSSQDKNIAISTYLRNGLKNHEIFGQKLDWLEKFETESGMSADGWLKVIAFGNELSTSKPADQVLVDFMGTGGYATLSTYIEKYSENWFGFAIPKDYAGGLITGITTGHWGFALSTNDKNHYYTDPRTGKEYTFPTLGSVFETHIRDAFAKKAFTWADKQFGWKPGTAQVVYQTGKKLLDSVVLLRQIKNVEHAQNLLSQGKMTQDAFDKVVQANKAGNEAINKANSSKPPYNAKQAATKAIASMVTDLVAAQVTKWVMSVLGDGISKMEQRLGLVPGSTAILISAGISYGVGMALHAMFPGTFGSMGPAGLYAALAMFVLTNLFGVYKIVVTCGADGYYPDLESPNTALGLDRSGLNTWDGQNSDTNQKMYIAAAQYKARRLIEDALEIHNNPLYKDIIPSQIMTGRKEDVDATNAQVASTICAAIDPNMPAIAGICNGNTRAGVWQNAQMNAYTHIGF